MTSTEDNTEYSNRSNDPIRVFLNSSSSSYQLTGKYSFYLNIDAYLENYDVYFQVRKIQCTCSWYNITTSNNTLELNGIYHSLDPGNYNIYEIIEILNNFSDWGVTFVYNSATAKVAINSTIMITWGQQSTIGPILGFSAIPAISQLSFLSDSLVDVTPIKVINFHLMTVPSRSFSVYDEYIGGTTRLVSSLFVGNAQPFSTISSSDETAFRESSLQTTIRSLEFVIVDQSGSVVDLQNGSFQMLLEFSFRPKKVMRLLAKEEEDKMQEGFL